MTPKNLSKETLAAALLQLVEMSANGRTSELSELFNAVRKDGTVEDFYFQTIVEAWAEGHGCVLIDQRRLSGYRLRVREKLKDLEKQKGLGALKTMWNGDLQRLREELFEEAEALTAECNALEARTAQLRTETFALEAKQIKVVEETVAKCDKRIATADQQIADRQALALKTQADTQKQVDEQLRSGLAPLERMKAALEQDILSLNAHRNALKEESFALVKPADLVNESSLDRGRVLAADLIECSRKLFDKSDSKAKDRWLAAVVAAVRDFSTVELTKGVDARRRMVIAARDQSSKNSGAFIATSLLDSLVWEGGLDQMDARTRGLAVLAVASSSRSTNLSKLRRLVTQNLHNLRSDKLTLIERTYGLRSQACSTIADFAIEFCHLDDKDSELVEHGNCSIRTFAGIPDTAIKWWQIEGNDNKLSRVAIFAELHATRLKFHFNPCDLDDEQFDRLVGEPIQYLFSTDKLSW
jgi:hypothetical protein